MTSIFHKIFGKPKYAPLEPDFKAKLIRLGVPEEVADEHLKTAKYVRFWDNYPVMRVVRGMGMPLCIIFLYEVLKWLIRLLIA